ncbi:MAG: hypothetical protein WBL63_26035 [Candidatus Acidiferrum sp.]
MTPAIQTGSKRLDPLHRFEPTPYRISLQLMGRTVCVETNSPKILELTLQFFASYPQLSQGDPEFEWRIVGESGHFTPPDRSTPAFSDRDLSFVNMGQRSFLAVDAKARLGVAFLDEGFTQASEPRFIVRPPLGTLLCMSAASLGLTSLSAACVALGEKGVVLLGEPNSGKTTAAYAAAMLGMEFFADQLVFLECAASNIYAWGDPFPAVFRPATLDFYPELRSEVRASSYGDVRFYYFDKSKLQRKQAHRVIPVCSVLLQRSVATEPRLVPLGQGQLSEHLAASLLFKDSDRFQSQHAAVFEGLAKLPSFRLPYGEDPATAATLVRDLLVEHAKEGTR